MKDILSLLAICVSALALCFSVLQFRANDQDRLERRHGEISNLKAEILKKESDAYQHFLSMQTQLKDTGREVRRLPDSKEKYEFLDDLLPTMLEKHMRQCLAFLNPKRRLSP